MFSQPLSLVRAETMGILSTSAKAFNLFLPSQAIVFARSAAMWVAVEADPPLPIRNTVLPFFQASNSISITLSTSSRGILSITPLASAKKPSMYFPFSIAIILTFHGLNTILLPSKSNLKGNSGAFLAAIACRSLPLLSGQ